MLRARVRVAVGLAAALLSLLSPSEAQTSCSDASLRAACGSAKAASAGNCYVCIGQHSTFATCDGAFIDDFCHTSSSSCDAAAAANVDTCPTAPPPDRVQTVSDLCDNRCIQGYAACADSDTLQPPLNLPPDVAQSFVALRGVCSRATQLSSCAGPLLQFRYTAAMQPGGVCCEAGECAAKTGDDGSVREWAIPTTCPAACAALFNAVWSGPCNTDTDFLLTVDPEALLFARLCQAAAAAPTPSPPDNALPESGPCPKHNRDTFIDQHGDPAKAPLGRRPCQHGGTCQPLGHRRLQGAGNAGDDSHALLHQCVCATNYYGPTCDTYCEAAVTCSGHGTCHPNGASLIFPSIFTTSACRCDAGFGGQNCEAQIPASCSNHGTYHGPCSAAGADDDSQGWVVSIPGKPPMSFDCALLRVLASDSGFPPAQACGMVNATDICLATCAGCANSNTCTCAPPYAGVACEINTDTANCLAKARLLVMHARNCTANGGSTNPSISLPTDAGWDPATSVCAWTGVTCDPITGLIVKLRSDNQPICLTLSGVGEALGNTPLKFFKMGSLSTSPGDLSSLSALTELTVLDIQGPSDGASVTGDLSSLSALTQLRLLHLSGKRQRSPRSTAKFAPLD
jgi:hypothetical protein